MATGLSSLTQQVGPTLGVPLLSTVAVAPATLLAGVHLALAVDVALSVDRAATPLPRAAGPHRDILDHLPAISPAQLTGTR